MSSRSISFIGACATVSRLGALIFEFCLLEGAKTSKIRRPRLYREENAIDCACLADVVGRKYRKNDACAPSGHLWKRGNDGLYTRYRATTDS